MTHNKRASGDPGKIVGSMDEALETKYKIQRCPGCNTRCTEGILVVVVRRSVRQRRLAHDEECIKAATEVCHVAEILGPYKLRGGSNSQPVLIPIGREIEQRVANADSPARSGPVSLRGDCGGSPSHRPKVAHQQKA